MTSLPPGKVIASRDEVPVAASETSIMFWMISKYTQGWMEPGALDPSRDQLLIGEGYSRHCGEALKTEFWQVRHMCISQPHPARVGQLLDELRQKKQLSCIFSITMNDPGDRLFRLFSGSRIWTSRTNLFSESLGGLRASTALAPVQFLVGGTEILKTMSHGPKKKPETKKLHKVVPGFWARIQKILLISCPWSFLLHLGCPWYWPHS